MTPTIPTKEDTLASFFNEFPISRFKGLINQLFVSELTSHRILVQCSAFLCKQLIAAHLNEEEQEEEKKEEEEEEKEVGRHTDDDAWMMTRRDEEEKEGNADDDLWTAYAIINA